MVNEKNRLFAKLGKWKSLATYKWKYLNNV